jgi:tRNA nucleotidyltransferase (CCA-adding enzyme)
MSALSDLFKPAHWSLLQELARRCAEAGGRAYLVGGCVRSALMGEPVQDFDVEVFGLQPEQLESVLRSIGKFARVGRAFGIYKLSGWPVDVGLPRRERKTGSGHRAFEINIDPKLSLPEAAQRRDFTVNALYYDCISGTVEDPLGGLADLDGRILRHCSDRFEEDPLRVLRAMQFAARLPADVAPETVRLCTRLTPEGLSPERYFAEWEKLLLQGKEPSRGLAFLKESGWVRYFPELEALCDCPQDPRWHPEGDVWAHTLHCMDAFAQSRLGDREEDLIVGFAVLCHDMGKPATTESVPEGIRSHGHEAAGIRPARTFMERLNVSNRILEQVLPLIKCHMRPAVLFRDQSSPAAVRRLARDCGRLDRLIRVFRADAAGRPPMEDDSAAAADWLMEKALSLKVASSRPKPLLNGYDLLRRGWKSGPGMGRFLDDAYEQQLDGRFSTREEALTWLKRQRSGKESSLESQSADEAE